MLEKKKDFTTREAIVSSVVDDLINVKNILLLKLYGHILEENMAVQLWLALDRWQPSLTHIRSVIITMSKMDKNLRVTGTRTWKITQVMWEITQSLKLQG